MADHQTAGRGSGDRQWLSPPRTGICLSFVLIPSFKPYQARELTMLVAYSIAVVLRETYGIPAMLKWPNDIMVQGKKIAGVLSEPCVAHDTIRYMVIGMGMNVHTRQFPPELKDIATSLHREGGGPFDRIDLIADCLKRIEQDYAGYGAKGSLEHIIPAYDALLIHRNQQIRLVTRTHDQGVLSKGINRHGELQVQDLDGSIRSISLGAVSVRGAFKYWQW